MSLAQWFRDTFAPEEGTISDITNGMQGAFAAKRKPRLVAVSHAPSRDEFAGWRDDPTTQFVFAALRNAAAEQKQAWDDVSWHGGEANAALLTALRTRADAYEALEIGDYADFCGWAGLEPEPEPREDNDAA